MVVMEEGKYYRTQDGRKVGPALRFNFPDNYQWRLGSLHFVDVNGFAQSGEPEDDIVAEWQDEPAVVADQTAPAPTNDNQAPATLNFNTTDANAKLDEIIAKMKLIDEMASELGISFTTQQAA